MTKNCRVGKNGTKRQFAHKKVPLLLTGMLQVFFVSVNTFFIAHLFYSGILIAAFFISYIWTFNIKKIAFGDHADRIVYAMGAAIGSILGVLMSQYIYAAI